MFILLLFIYLYPAGLDIAHASMLKEISSQRGVNVSTSALVHLMYLSDNHQLLPEDKVPRYDPRVEGRVYFHVILSNSTHL